MSPSFKLITILVIVAFLAIAIYLLVNHIVYLLTITHNVQIEIAEDKGRSKETITFKVINNGILPVNHLNLKVVAQYEIVNYTKDLSTVDVDYREITPRFIESYAPKLIHGTGSFILISVSANESKPTGYNKYSAYAVYDEGSSKADFTSCLTPCHQLHDIEKGLATVDKSIKISILAIGVATLGAMLLLIIMRYLDYLKTFATLARRKL